MIEGQPSHSALHVAAARAAHLRYDPGPHLLVDDFAEGFLGEQAEGLIPNYADDGYFILIENRLAFPLRSRYAEDRLAAAYRKGVRQLVILGAGLDSYALRRPSNQPELRIFEVDHPSTQRWKTARMRELDWEIPECLHMVPCDFEKSRVSEVLRAAAFEADEPAIVSWLGVVYYLQAETAQRVLVDLREFLTPGSEVIFDYQFPFEDLPERYQDVFTRMNAYLEDVGEPQHTRYRPDALREVILGAGYADAILERHEDLYARYYAPLASKVPMSERFGFAVAQR